MKFISISDTHRLHYNIPAEWLQPADCIIHAGDISRRGSLEDVEDFLYWYNSLTQYTHKIFIPGNHDFGFEKFNRFHDLIMNAVKFYPNITFLNDSFVEIENIKIYGSPWQPWFHNWAFNLHRGAPLKEKWDLIPEDTDILVTHGPAYGHGDLVIHDNKKVGCEDLLQAIEKIKPRFHICGHIHCGYGVTTNENTTFINASTVDEDYIVVNQPLIFTLEKP